MRAPFLLLLVFLAFQVPVHAQVPEPSFPMGKPIDTRMGLGLFGLLGGGMEYSVQGRPISRYEDFKTVIYPVRDRESSDLIRQAEEAHLTAWIFYTGGAALAIDVALNFKPAPFLGVDWIDRAATGFAFGQILMGAGFLFDSNAEARKYNAVQRYNYLVGSRHEAALDLVPPRLAFGPSGARCLIGARF